MSRSASCKLGLVTVNVDEVGFGLVKCEPVKITLKQDAKPYHVSVARRIPTPLQGKVAKELARMESEGIIKPVTKPTSTDWCAPMVVVMKKNGNLQ